MRIDDRNAIAGNAAGRASDVDAAQAAVKAKSSSSASLSRTGGDSVELSGTSQSVHYFQAARGARVAQLSKAVQNGSYSVTPSLISRALVGESLASSKEFAAS